MLLAVNAHHPLGQLIEQVQEANGWSDRDVEVIAERRGQPISRSNISRIRNQPVTTMKLSQMRALAGALKLPIRVLVAAALESMGLPTYGSSELSPEDALQADHSIPLRERNYLLAMLAEIRRSHGTDGAVQGVRRTEHRTERVTGPIEPSWDERTEDAADSRSHG